MTILSVLFHFDDSYFVLLYIDKYCCIILPDLIHSYLHHYRVKGVERLRVVDASVMPTLMSADLLAPSIMMAEKAADMIKNAHAAKNIPKTVPKTAQKTVQKKKINQNKER